MVSGVQSIIIIIGHGSVQVDMVLTVLHLAGNMKWSLTLGGILSLGNHKACPTVT